jgi:hypothetical protein
MIKLINSFETISIWVLGVMFSVVAFFITIYILDLFWNFVRALRDRERGFNYYFSRQGPKNSPCRNELVSRHAGKRSYMRTHDLYGRQAHPPDLDRRVGGSEPQASKP